MKAQHDKVMIFDGTEFFPDEKDPGVLYLAASGPGQPLNVACRLTPERFKLLQELVQNGNHRVIGYNAVRPASAFSR